MGGERGGGVGMGEGGVRIGERAGERGLVGEWEEEAALQLSKLREIRRVLEGVEREEQVEGEGGVTGGWERAERIAKARESLLDVHAAMRKCTDPALLAKYR